MAKPTVCIVGTGGTIASKYDPKIGGSVSTASAEDLVAAVPELSGFAEIRVIDHCNVNSAVIDTPTVFALRDTLRKPIADETVSGTVVTHGTATLEETAYMMDITLGDEKLVVFTGAQRDFDERDADGPSNIRDAVMLAAEPTARGKGVLVAFAGEIHAAREAMKVSTDSLAAFASRDGGPIGVVTKSGVTFWSAPERRLYLNVDHVKENVQLVVVTQGSNDLLLRACIRERVDGIVVAGVGDANMNLSFYRAVSDALEAGIPVVVSTRVLSGSPHQSKVYPGSARSVIRRGAIAAGYLSALKARILLMVAHTQDREELAEIFARA